MFNLFNLDLKNKNLYSLKKCYLERIFLRLAIDIHGEFMYE